MRFKKGTEVEVLSDTGGFSGSWMCGEIVNGNGRYYTVKYRPNVSKKGEAVFGRVGRGCLRPRPPVLYVKSWAPRDIVEVRCDISWKLALVLHVIDKDNYMVKFIGSPQELKSHKCDIRPRLVWKDEKWVLTGKGRRLVCSNSGRGDDAGDNIYAVQCVNDSLFSCLISSRKLMRASPCGSSLIGNAKKKLKTRIDEKHKPVPQTRQAEKVDAVAYPPQLYGNKYMQSSFNVGRPAYHNLQRESPNLFVCPLSQSRELNETSVASSVGSCSFSGGRGNELQCPDITALSTDADSLCLTGGDAHRMLNLSPDEMLAAERYRLELRAYHKMLEAFHASGAISWEKEELLTDLRISLHISDDDHLLELKRLSFGSRPMMQQIT